MKKSTIVLLLMLFAFYANAQFTISGTVTNEQNQALVGVSVQLKNSQLGTVTDYDGHFTLKHVNAGDLTLMATYMGYELKSINLNLSKDETVSFILAARAYLTEEVIVSSLRPGDKAPGTISSLNKEEIDRQNMGQDIPYLLSLTPSIVTTSDAGAGIGYTGFRIRGTDGNRINVTVNGIPLNDAESHGVYWVDMPDFASSIDNVVIQRGVGTSTNGSGAFGASINMQTNTLEKDAFTEISSSVGSFNSFKNTVKVGSGLLKDHFAFDARISKITSDGFVDRAYSDLKSYYVSGGYYSEKTLVKINVFGGMEETYQSWWGVPKVRLQNDTIGMQRYEDHGLYTLEQTIHMKNSDSRTYNYYTYNNEIDHYNQDHAQLFLTQKLLDKLTFNTALHYTYGRGYYEQFRNSDDFADYGLNNVVIGQEVIESTDLVRRKWLNNDFYGVVASLNYKADKLDATFGGAANKYDGRHYGNIIWAQYFGETEKDYEWYRSTGVKSDMNIYGKANVALMSKLNLYVDLQVRNITHTIEGIDDDLRNITQTHKYTFFNPKAGLFYKPTDQQEAYFFYARGNREPNRSNFTDAAPNGPQPKAEALNDFELGYSYKHKTFTAGANLYYMQYNNQLVLTGQINDVGSAIMTNVKNSYRTGIELFGGLKLFDKIFWDVNCTLSQNRITDFTEYVDNYTKDWDVSDQAQINHKTTDIAFSPSVIANSTFKVVPFNGLSIALQSQFVGKQYIDNSSSNARMLNPYFVNNLRLSYSVRQNLVKELNINLLVNNLFNTLYESNAWVYSYIYENKRYEMDGYFAQAGINFMLGINVRF